MKPKHIKDVLLSEIRAVAAKPEEFCYDPYRDYTQKVCHKKSPLGISS